MNIYRVLLSVVLVTIAATTPLLSQSFLGLGAGIVEPTTGFADQSKMGLHGELEYGVHRFCNVWPVLTLNYGRYEPLDTVSALTYSHPNVFTLQGSIRWFPWGSTTLPLYASLGTGLSVITGDDEESVVGMPGSIEVGYLLFYKNPCCDWFITAAARYSAFNMLRDLQRPHLSSVSGILRFSMPLGKGGAK